MSAMSEDYDDEITEDQEEEEHSQKGSATYQRLRTLPTYSTKDWQAWLQHIQKHRPEHFAIVHTMVDLGLPLVAVLGLNIGHVDFKQCVLQVRQGWGKTGVFPIPNHKRPFHPHGDWGQLHVLLTSASTIVLRDQLGALITAGRPVGPTDWLFPGRGNKPWKFRYITNYTILPALKHCGMAPMFPKDLYYCIHKTRIEEELRHDHSK